MVVKLKISQKRKSSKTIFLKVDQINEVLQELGHGVL